MEFLSDYFLVHNGVKLDSVLSPVLFCVYIDDLLLQLSKVAVGCFIGTKYAGVLAYADDILLVAPTASARIRVKCWPYVNSMHQITFNAQKSNVWS